MNLFALSYDLDKCVKYHVDRHVHKIILEAAQLLCTAAFSVYDSRKPWTGYKPTHQNIPLCKWVAASKENWLWTREYARHLNSEWNYRYQHKKQHASLQVIEKLQVPNLPSLGLQPFVQAMPAYCKHENSIVAYRQYYALEKFHLHTWTGRKRPFWLNEHLRNCLLNYGTLEHMKEFQFYLSLYPNDTEVLFTLESLQEHSMTV